MSSATVKVASMFAGIGGICLGFKQVGCSIVWANEINGNSCETYRTNFGNEYLIEGDIKKVNPMDIPHVDILTAGFPCQAFSIGGKQRGFDDSRGTMFFEVARIVEAKRPRMVFMENVENLIEHNNGNTFIVIYNTFAELGYFVKYKVMPSNEYGGVPQNRKRIYIIAFKDCIDCENFSFPEPITLTQNVFDIINRTKKSNDVYYYDMNSDLYRRLNLFIQNKTDIFRIYNGQVRRVKTSGISPTLTASMNNPNNAIVFKDNYGIRRLTIKECLALQGFPAGYKISDRITLEDAYKQIGNSVSVPVVKNIAEQMLKIM